MNIYMILGGVMLSVPLVVWIIIPIIEKIAAKKNRNRWLNNWISENIEKIELKVESFVQNTKLRIDKYEQQIEKGQDKYQIGRALYRYSKEFENEYHQLFTKEIPYSLVGQVKEIGSIQQKIAEIELCKQRLNKLNYLDISIENGFIDAQTERKKIENEQKSTRLVQEAVNQHQKKSSEHDIITKIFTGSEAMVAFQVNNFIKAHKNYVLEYQSPLIKNFLGFYQTTITMKKIK